VKFRRFASRENVKTFK